MAEDDLALEAAAERVRDLVTGRILSSLVAVVAQRIELDSEVAGAEGWLLPDCCS